jgi:Uma2 family endonuclease
VEEYRRLGREGILREDDRVELLDGWIVRKMIHDPQHDVAIELADEALRRHLPPGFRVRIQSVVTTRDSEPEPDLAVVRGDPRRRRKRHPTPAEVALVVEVADTSLETDRSFKAALYARARIPVYWIVNVADGQVEVYTEPSRSPRSAQYKVCRVYKRGESVPLVVLGRRVGEIPVAELLP